jgi:predicted RNA-binding protein with PIN domain
VLQFFLLIVTLSYVCCATGSRKGFSTALQSALKRYGASSKAAYILYEKFEKLKLKAEAESKPFAEVKAAVEIKLNKDVLGTAEDY